MGLMALSAKLGYIVPLNNFSLVSRLTSVRHWSENITS